MVDLQYYGNIYYFNYLLKNSFAEISNNLQYSKGWFANKTIITGANGNQILSVPLAGGRNQKSLLKDVKLSYDYNWRQQHKKAIFSCYGNAPYFDYYNYLFELIYKQKFSYLTDLNLFVLEKMLNALKIEIEINKVNESSFEKEIAGTKQHFLKLENFNHPKYTQVFEDRNSFQANLSIIDLLFCEGPNAKKIIKF